MSLSLDFDLDLRLDPVASLSHCHCHALLSGSVVGSLSSGPVTLSCGVHSVEKILSASQSDPQASVESRRGPSLTRTSSILRHADGAALDCSSTIRDAVEGVYSPTCTNVCSLPSIIPVPHVL